MFVKEVKNMLYGMDEDEYVQQEYGLIEKRKLNIKKVIIVIIILIMCFLLIFGSFFISYKNLNDNKNATALLENKILDNTIEKFNEDKYENIVIDNTIIEVEDVELVIQKVLPQENPNGQQMIKDIYYSEEKQVYLTFDDGPSKDITPQVLDILKQNDVKATFFVLGARVDLYPETLRRIFDEGHYIANHGYSHKYSEIYRSKDTIFEEYIWCENSIKTALNNPDYNSYLFRFPGGSTGGKYSRIKSEGRELLNTYGIAYTNWNCLTGDAEGKKTKEDCIAELINTKGEQKSLIVLMHDANDKQQTVDALPEIIQYFKNEGYTFKTFYEIFKTF